jgi:hypothetical protein
MVRLFYKLEYERMSVCNPLVDDRDLFYLAITAPSFNLQRIIDSASGTGLQIFEVRCAYIREPFMTAAAKAVTDSPSGRGSPVFFETRASGECQT